MIVRYREKFDSTYHERLPLPKVRGREYQTDS